MIARGKLDYLLPAVLAAVCAALAWTVYDRLQATPDLGGPPGAGGAPAAAVAGVAAGVDPLPSSPDFRMPPPESFLAIVERPIFSPDRRPSEEPGLEAPASDLEATVRGIIISDKERKVLLSPKDGSDLLRLAEGDQFRGWTVTSIEPDRATFRRDDVEKSLGLAYDEAPPHAQRPRVPLRPQMPQPQMPQPQMSPPPDPQIQPPQLKGQSN